MAKIQITNKLKNYGKQTELWYHPHQGDVYELNLDTKKGFLVKRPETETNGLYLVKHSHAEIVEYDDDLDDDMVQSWGNPQRYLTNTAMKLWRQTT